MCLVPIGSQSSGIHIQLPVQLFLQLFGISKKTGKTGGRGECFHWQDLELAPGFLLSLGWGGFGSPSFFPPVEVELGSGEQRMLGILAGRWEL